jgi:antitoxin VapB
VARRTGETKTEAVTQALRERLTKLRRAHSKQGLTDELEAIAKHCASLPVLDAHTPNEILGYDDRGLPR